MKKFILLISVFFSTFTYIYALPITFEKAVKIANNFVNRKASIYGNSEIKNLTNIVELEPYYIFNIGDKKGFVIVSGDDSLDPILGYSYEGDFNPMGIPDNVKELLKSYEVNILEIQKQKYPAKSVHFENNDERKKIPILVKSKWNQSAPYNDLCPDFGKGKCVAGCVPISMAQVMNYYNWPSFQISEIPSYTIKYGEEKERIVDALPCITFDWEGASIEHIGNKDYDKAVAEICRYSGQVSEAGYSLKSTSSNFYTMVDALVKYMHFSPSIMCLDKRLITSEEEWERICYDELKKQRPILVSGNSDTGKAHAFICDGYENGKFHINWGWGGHYDGYFKLTYLTPEGAGIGGDANTNYSNEMWIVLNAVPNPCNFKVYSEPIITVSNFSKTVVLKLNCDNNNYTSLQFDIALPKGVSIESNSDGTPKINLKTLSNHSLSCNKLDNNNYRIIISSASNNNISMRDHELISFNIIVDEKTIINNKSFILTKKGVVCNSLYQWFELNQYSIPLVLSEKKLLGDVNGDGYINNKDVDSLIESVVENEFDLIRQDLSDINNDDIIDIADIMILIDKIRKEEGKECYFIPTVNEGFFVLGAIDVKDKDDKKHSTLWINMVNEPIVKALQFTIKFPKDAYINHDWPDITERTELGFKNYYKSLGDGMYRFLVFSPDGINIDKHYDYFDALSVKYNTPLTIEFPDIVFVTSDLKRIRVKGEENQNLGINEINTIYNGTREGIFSLDGVKLNNNEKIPNGIYIKNGKKIIIK